MPSLIARRRENDSMIHRVELSFEIHASPTNRRQIDERRPVTYLEPELNSSPTVALGEVGADPIFSALMSLP